MPKFYRQNKKKINPRYFLNETTNRDLNEACWDGYKQVGMKMKSGRKVPNCVPMEEAIDSSFDGEMDAMRGIRPGKDMMSDPSYSSGYNSVKSKQKSFNTELLRIFSNRLEKIDDKLRKDNERDPRRLPLRPLINKVDNSIAKRRTLINKVDNSIAKRPGLSDDEYDELDAAMKDESSIRAFDIRVLAMLDGMQSGVDTDSDGIPDEKELAIIDKGEI